MSEVKKKSLATLGYHPRLALVFDFDKTLAPDSLDGLLDYVGLDREEFHAGRVARLMEEGWDQILAQMFVLIQASRRGECKRITQGLLEEFGGQLELYPGAPELFGRVREHVRGLLDEMEVRFYVVTCGLIQMHRAHPVAAEFDGMWGSEIYFDDAGEAAFAKCMITFPEKVHYLLALSKGSSMRGPNEPADAYRPVPHHDLHIPLSQILYVGDGASDMPTFDLMRKNGGLALGVVDAARVEDWPGYEEMREEHRVQNLAPADYREGAELLESIRLAVASIAMLVALRKLGQGE